MKFSQDFIEKVQDANNIVDIISQYTELKPMAGGFMGRCPFPDHQEKTPSFSVSEVKQVYNCFGCHKKGNTFTFVQQLIGLSFPDAVEFLANRAQIPIPQRPDEDVEKLDQLAKKKKEIIQINKLAAGYFFSCFQALSKTHPAKQYALEKRGLSAQTIEEFQIGYVSEDWDGLTTYLQKKGVSLSLAEEARLVKSRPQGNGHYDIFRDRLMFPILNQIGEVIAFGGRIIDQGEPKYLNSGETPVFNKSKTLYGLYQSSRFIRSDDQCLIVEGYMDLISLYQHGIRNVVATMGTALTQEHGKLLGRMTKNIVVLFDGDEAGKLAAERSLPILLASDLHPKGLVLPEQSDPDDFVREQGAESLNKLVLNSADLFSMVLSIWTLEFHGEASEKVQLADRLRPIFDAIYDARLKNLYIEEAAKKIRVDTSWMIQALKQPKKNSLPIENSNKKLEVKKLEAPSSRMVPDNSSYSDMQISLQGIAKVEALILGLSLKSSSNFNILLEANIISLLANKGLQTLLEKAAMEYRQVPEKFDKLAGLFATYIDRPELLFPPQFEKLSLNEQNSDNTIRDENRAQEVKLLTDCIKRVRENHLKKLIQQLAIEIKQNPDPLKLEQFMSLKRELVSLSKESSAVLNMQDETSSNVVNISRKFEI